MTVGLVIQPNNAMLFANKDNYRTLMQLLHHGLTKDHLWSSVKLPLRGGGLRQNCNIAPLESPFLVQIEPSPSMKQRIRPPVPISGVLIPIFNLPHPDRSLTLQSYSIAETILTSYWTYRRPILVIVLHGTNQLPIGDLSDPLWWVTDVVGYSRFWTTAVALSVVSTVQTADLGKLPELIVEHFRLPEWNVNRSGTIRLPLLPHIEVHPSHLGTQKHASVGFVRDFVRNSLPLEQPLRVWFDMVPSFKAKKWDTPGFLNLKIGDDKLFYEESFFRDEYLLLAEPTIYETQDGRYLVEPAFHAYVEYEGEVSDSLVAFQIPVSIDQFQANLKSVHREQLEISAGMLPNHAIALIDEQLRRTLSITKE